MFKRSETRRTAATRPQADDRHADSMGRVDHRSCQVAVCGTFKSLHVRRRERVRTLRCRE